MLDESECELEGCLETMVDLRRAHHPEQKSRLLEQCIGALLRFSNRFEAAVEAATAAALHGDTAAQEWMADFDLPTARRILN
jgi:hypothetical protein